jgi:hypothetical protein
VLLGSPQFPWILSCIYGPLDKRDKLAFWDSFTSVAEGFVSPWLCIGDLNYMLDQSEKLGDGPIANSSLCLFKHFIDHFGFVDLGFVGNPFTWCNNRQGATSIKERLDRGLASLSWIHLHLEFSLKHIHASSSDHHLISLNTALFSSFLPSPFCFEEFWTKDPSCGSVIEAAWFKPASGSPTQRLVSKLLHTKNALQRWNYLHFGKIQAQIEFTLAKVDAVQKPPPNSSSFS